ncbi:MAG TPA: hypothetical protein VLQ48_00375 [Chloroflexia bacterium]|nr:hypothetical protein [Chloroflexia bacterium]
MDARAVRQVQGHTINSGAQPAIKLRIADDLAYLGSLRFLIKGIAEAEVFLFADADSEKQITRLLVIQFEGFLDNNNYTYEYPIRNTVMLGQHQYVHDTFVYAIAPDLEEADSDSAQTFGFILKQGYTLPIEIVSCRLIRALDSTRRTEILFSYAEDLSLRGLSADNISSDNRPTPPYAYLEEELLRQALSSFTVAAG